MAVKPRRGEIWLTNLNPTIGHEQNKIRPCLIISTDSYNAGPAGMVTVLPMTSKNKQIPWHIPLAPHDTGLEITSFVICDQPRAISTERLLKRMPGTAPEDDMVLIDECLRTLLDL